MAKKLFDDRPGEPISPLIDVVANGLAAVFIILMIYIVVVQPNRVERLRFLRGVEPSPAFSGRSYVFTFPVAGGLGERRFRLLDGAPPAGLALDSLTGTLFGTPAEAPGRALAVRVEVRDSAGGLDTLSASLRVHPAAVPYAPETAPLSISRRTAELPTARAGAPYEAVLGALGGVEPYTWRVAAGALPPGLVLDGGRLAGTPARAGLFRFTVEVGHSAGRFLDEGRSVSWWGGVQRRAFALRVVEGGVRHSLHLPEGRVGEPYLGFVRVAGAPSAEPVGWTAAVPGLTPSPDGSLAGTPRAPGRFAVSYRVGADPALSGSGTVRVLPPRPPASVGPAVVRARVGDSLRFAVPYRGLREPVAVRLVGAPPEGLALVDGELAGVPRTPGEARVRLRAVDAAGHAAEGEVRLRIAAAPARLSMDSLVPVAVVVGRPVRHPLAAAGGEGAREWSAAGLPPGLALADGVVAGTVRAPGTWRSTVRVRDRATGAEAAGVVAFRAVHAEDSRPRLASATVPAALVGVPFEFVPPVEGGVGTVRLEVGGRLPAGLRFTGRGISGTPLAAGETWITLTATDQAGQRDGPHRLRVAVERPARGVPRVATRALPPAVAGREYAQTFAAEGGSGRYRWSFAGSLPRGLRFGADGIEGTVHPGASGVWTVVARVRDETGAASAPATLTLATAAAAPAGWPPLALPAAPLPRAYAHVPYDAPLLADGCGGRCTWSVAGLPEGFRLRDGRIQGTARRPGTYRLQVAARDAFGRQVRGPAVLVVHRPPSRGSLPARIWRWARGAV